MSWSDKGGRGHFFEDFAIGETHDLPIPRTVGAGEATAYIALTGDRTPVYAGAAGLVHPWVVFHTVFGQTVRHVSLNAVANLGYADLRWTGPVHVGDTLRARITVIGLKENSSKRSGIVYLTTSGLNQHGAEVLRYTRWVMVKKRSDAPTPYLASPAVPELPSVVAPTSLHVPRPLVPTQQESGGAHRFADYSVGERIAHDDGMTLNESDHMSFTRLFQNSAKIHFDAMATSGRPLIYGGVVISIGYALAFNGFENRVGVRAVNAGTHANPSHAGDTLYAYTEVLDAAALGGELGALRLRLVVTKNLRPWEASGFSLRVPDSKRPGCTRHHPNVVLELDYWDAMAV